MPVLRPGEVVQSERGEGRWQVERKIGEGQFSEVYSVVEQDTQVQRAVKIEKRTDVRTVRQEYKVLRRLQAGCRQAVRVHEGGEYAGGRFYMVMDLLGPNLTSARRSALGGALELTAAKVVAASMLSALEQVHAEGYIHRDVKPANFVMDPADAPDPASAAWALVDFGLARQYVDEASRQPLPPRPEAAFRGSTTYASVNCHRLEDQSRRDDLWGWFYCLVELIEGTLPWRSDRDAAAPAATNTATLGAGGADSQLALLPSPPQDGSQGVPAAGLQQQAGGAGGGAPGLSKEQVLQRKLECLEQPQLLVTSIPCPQAVVDLSNYLRGLGFEDAPNHHYMRSLLGKLDGPTVDPHSRPQSGDMAAAAALAAAQQASGTAEVAPGSSAGHPAAAQETAAAPAEASLPNGRHQQHGTPAGWEAGRGGGVMLASSRPASRASSPRGGATAGAAADRRPSRLGRQDEVQQQQQQGMAPPAAGKEQRADPREGRRQQGQEGAAAPLSGQRSRDRSRERGRDEGRGRRRRSDSPSSDRSRSSRSYSRSSSSRRSGSASRSRSRGRERGRRSRSSSRSRSRDRERERRAREYSRERGRRSRSRDRGSRRSRSRARERERERDRERAREREREQERARARRRSSRSRSGDRYARRNDSAAAAAPARRRSRSRSPYAGSSRVQQRRGSGSGAKEAALAAAAPAATAAREAAHAPAEGAGGQAPAGGAPAGHAEPAAVPQYTTDMHAQYRAGLELVFALRQGGLSEAGAAACRQLRGLEPAEAAGVVCWLIDELATGAEQRHLPAVGAFCEEIAAFALGTAKRCGERSRQR